MNAQPGFLSDLGENPEYMVLMSRLILSVIFLFDLCFSSSCWLDGMQVKLFFRFGLICIAGVYLSLKFKFGAVGLQTIDIG